MIPIFRKIRKKMADDNRPLKYLRYAIGEIILVVIGILIAIQLNNLNEEHNNEAQFKAILEQIYTVIDQDAEQITVIKGNLDEQIVLINTISEHPDSIDPKLLPHLLFYIDLSPIPFTSEVPTQLSYLNFNPGNLMQSNLNKSLASYSNAVIEDLDFNKKGVTLQLEKVQLPFPGLLFGYSVLNNYENIDTGFFSNDEIKRAEKLIKNPIFQNALKSSRSAKALNSLLLTNKIHLAETNKNKIREYYPDVKLLYSNIGLTGTATQNNSWDNDIPLKLTNELESIWEADVVLDNGLVKFREGENWNFNWGGENFPAGPAKYFGENIKVEAGNYHVIFNLSNKSYQFIKTR